MGYESLLVVVATGGTPLDPEALTALADTRVVWTRVECEGRSMCLAARVRHADRPDVFRARVRSWAGSRHWVVTVAPCAPPL
jgi:hypothetical protein